MHPSSTQELDSVRDFGIVETSAAYCSCNCLVLQYHNNETHWVAATQTAAAAAGLREQEEEWQRFGQHCALELFVADPLLVAPSLMEAVQKLDAYQYIAEMVAAEGESEKRTQSPFRAYAHRTAYSNSTAVSNRFVNEDGRASSREVSL